MFKYITIIGTGIVLLLAPSQDQIVKENWKVVKRGAREILFETSSPFETISYLYNRYLGSKKIFKKYKTNPIKLSPEQQNKPAIILLHANNSNQGQWIPLVKYLRENNIDSAIFTLNYNENSARKILKEKIEHIKTLYHKKVELILIGHSFGGLLASEFAYLPLLQIENIKILEVIALASRLKNVEPLEKTPYFSYSYRLFNKVDLIWNYYNINKKRPFLTTLTAEKDWLLAKESTHVGEKKYIIKGVGHILIAQKIQALKIIIERLNEYN